MLPAAVKRELAPHMAAVEQRHEADVRQGAGWVELPSALARKYPNAGHEWPWQWVFPAPGSAWSAPRMMPGAPFRCRHALRQRCYAVQPNCGSAAHDGVAPTNKGGDTWRVH